MTFGTPAPADAGLDFGMTDLEERLRGPAGPEIRDGLLGRLKALEAHLREEAASGLPPGAFKRNVVIGRAVAAAHAVAAAFPVLSTAKGDQYGAGSE